MKIEQQQLIFPLLEAFLLRVVQKLNASSFPIKLNLNIFVCVREMSLLFIVDYDFSR